MVFLRDWSSATSAARLQPLMWFWVAVIPNGSEVIIIAAVNTRAEFELQMSETKRSSFPRCKVKEALMVFRFSE